jgi:DNA-directed RNA polymerase sigma subunit (sigma70/sigma32)
MRGQSSISSQAAVYLADRFLEGGDVNMNIRVSERRYRDSWNSVSTHEAISLNQPIGAESGDPVELGELVADPRAENLDDELDRSRCRSVVRRALTDLPDRERLVLERHYGLTGPPETLQQIGSDLGLTRERQLEAYALATLSHDPALQR